MKIEINDETLVVCLNGEIDHHSAKDIRSEIDKKIYETMPKSLVLDFDKVSFMDSSGIGLVIGRYKLINEFDGEIVVANLQPSIAKVMKLSGIDKFAKIVSTKK